MCVQTIDKFMQGNRRQDIKGIDNLIGDQMSQVVEIYDEAQLIVSVDEPKIDMIYKLLQWTKQI